MLKEIHHRVKNNLQVISSLVNLQTLAVTDAHAKDVLQDTNARVRSIALVHENLYLTENLVSIDAATYLKSLTMGLVHTYSANVTLECIVEDIHLSIEAAIPCGLIVTELVSTRSSTRFRTSVAATLSSPLPKPRHKICCSRSATTVSAFRPSSISKGRRRWDSGSSTSWRHSYTDSSRSSVEAARRFACDSRNRAN